MCCAVVLSTCRVPNLSHAARSMVDRCPGRRLRGSHLLGCDDGRRRKLHACVHVDMQFIRSIGFHHQKKDYPEETLMPWSDVLEATAPQLSRELMRVTGETISSTHGRSSLNLPTIADRKDAQSRARKRVLLQDTALHCHWSTCMSPQASPGHPRPLLRVLNEPGSTSRRTEKIAENAFTVESM